MSWFHRALKRFPNISLAVFMLLWQVSFAATPFITSQSALASPTKITGKEHQGQKSDLSYTSGNITEYKEGDFIKFRFTLEATHGPTSGQVEVRFTGDDSTCTFFDNTFILGAVTGTGPQPTVTTVGAPVAQNFGTSNGEWVQLLNINYPATFDHVSNEAIVNYTLRLSQEAGECNGSSQHSRLNPAGGTVEQTGAQNVPVPANQIIELPEIFIQKWVDTNADGIVDRKATAGEWSFSLDGGTPVLTDANGNVTFTNVTPNGNHTVTETNGPAGQTFLSGSGTNCTFQGSTATANVQSGTTAQDATCIFNNGVAPGSITIVKNAIPDSTQNFGFTSSAAGFANFQLDDETGANTDAVPESINIPNLPAGTYTFTEAQVAGWYLDQIDCPNISETQNVANGTLSLTIAAGQNVTCTFTNRQIGQIIVTKQTNPDNDPTQFSIAANPASGVVGNANQTITDNASVTYSVKHGTYNVDETVPAGWTMSGNTCSQLVIDGNTPLVNGIPTLSCTITNTKLAALNIVKDALPNDAQDFGFTTTNLAGAIFSLDDDSDGTLPNTRAFIDLLPGSYSVTESSIPGWALTGLSCDTNNFTANGSTVSVNLAAGQISNCTFVNTKLVSIAGTKYAVSSTGVPGSGLEGWTIFIDGNSNGILDPGELSSTTDVNGNYSFTNLLPGSFTLNEVLISGWTQIFKPAPFTLNAGETATDKDFGNFQNGSISGFKWNDVNGNGTYDNEPKLDGWTITLFNDNNDPDTDLNNQVAQTVTAGGGNYSFANLAPGSYAVCETQQAGWTQTFPAGNTCHQVEIDQSGETNSSTNFGNQGRGSIQVIKNVDSNGDGQVDQTGATDWTWDIDGAGNFATGSSQPVAAGSYTVSEDQKTDFHFVSVDCGNEQVSQSESVSVTVSPGENIICTFTNARDTGSIIVNKVLSPTDDTGKFNLEINGSTAGTGANVGNGGTTGTVSVVTGQYTIGESAGTSTNLADYSTQYVCLNGRTVVASGSTTTSTTFSVNTGDNIVCTITNTRLGKIIVQKQTDPDGSLQPFSFTASYDGDGFSLSDGQSNNSGNLMPGDYSVSENTPLGWDLTSAVCSDQSNPASISLQPGETVTCVFTNTQDANIVVVKQTNPDGSQQSFDFTASYDGDGFSLSDGQSNNSGDLDPGTYAVSENVPAGWDLESATCDDGSAPGSVSLQAGETVTCTFTNEQDAHIIVVKQTDPDGSPEVFNFNASYDGDGFSLSDGQQNDSGDLAPGIYSVSEIVPGGWQLKNTACSDQSDSSAISLSAGETVTCTFTNEQDAHIVVIKQTLPDGDPQTFDFTASYDGDGFTLGDGASNNSGDLDPGTYSVGETLPDGWDLDSAVCSDQSEPSNISLQAGETVTCTFTNAKRGSITIVKDAQPDAEQEFKFTGSLGDPDDVEGPNFTLVDNGQPGNTQNSRLFENLEDGTYTVTEPNVKGWTLESINCNNEEGVNVNNRNVVIGLEPGENVTCTFVNTRDTADITVHKITEPADAPETFEINLRNDDEGAAVVHSSNLKDGESDTYTVETNSYNLAEENIPEGWDLANAYCTDDEGETFFDPRNGSFEVSKDVDIDCTFVNHKRATVVVTKYNDFDRDGEKDADEPTLPGWDFTLSGNNPCEDFVIDGVDTVNALEHLICSSEIDTLTQTTGADGTTTFENVLPRRLHILTETLQPEWTLSNIDCGEEQQPEREIFQINQESDPHYLFPQPGETVNCFVGNYQEPLLEISKSNNRPNPTTTGDTVTYTLTVNTPDNSGAVYNTTVQDLPPENFDYVPGSWTANSSLRGDLKAEGPTTEPTYGSPGEWTLGRLLPGEIVTLTYQAKIASSVITGQYPDFAFASGCQTTATCGTSGPAVVLANVSTGASTPFVGTQVSINSPAVLGASTTRLVNTGAADIWRNMLIAGFIILVTAATFAATRTQRGGRS